eukprot:scaffold1583_cov299-Pinguiococcus_pyrenoidosus.AAC.21
MKTFIRGERILVWQKGDPCEVSTTSRGLKDHRSRKPQCHERWGEACLDLRCQSNAQGTTPHHSRAHHTTPHHTKPQHTAVRKQGFQFQSIRSPHERRASAIEQEHASGIRHRNCFSGSGLRGFRDHMICRVRTFPDSTCSGVLDRHSAWS